MDGIISEESEDIDCSEDDSDDISLTDSISMSIESSALSNKDTNMDSELEFGQVLQVPDNLKREIKRQISNLFVFTGEQEKK